MITSIDLPQEIFAIDMLRALTLFRGGGRGYVKFAHPSADLIFRIEEKFFTAPFFLLLIFFSYAIFVKKWAQMVENYGQGETFVKGDWKISIHSLLNN